jgi:hypothetical protein
VTPPPPWSASRAKRWQVAAIAAAGYPLLAALGATYRWQVDGREHLDRLEAAGRHPILALWHGRILPATLFFRDRGIVVLASENFDGEWIARLLARFGYGSVRGSTSRGGARALVQLKRLVEDGRTTAFTVDGPRGPALVAQPGAVWLAKATGEPILPFHVEASRSWRVRSWDRAQVPRPFSRVTMCLGAPIEVPGDADDEAVEAGRVRLQEALLGLVRRAEALASARR